MSMIYNNISENAANLLAKSYSVLDYSQNYKRVLSTIFPEIQLDDLSKRDLHALINEILINNHRGEAMIKSKLVNMFIKKKVTAAFEIKVNNSRADFVKVNGDTVSYEIKSGNDNLQKLSKQVSDYERVFEYNYIVIDEKHYQAAVKLIPDHYGIYILKGAKLIEHKPAQRNTNLNSIIQLKLFSKKELLSIFNTHDLDFIKSQNDSNKINEGFKEMLKKRYSRRWSFLKENIAQIFPVDYQYFFQNNINPSIIYTS